MEDHCDAILCILNDGKPGETYNVGGDSEQTNLELLDTLFASIGFYTERADGRTQRDYQKLIEFVTDRPGHDQRYAIDASKIKQLG